MTPIPHANFFTAKYLLNYAANLANNVLFKSVAELWAMGAAGIGDNAYANIDYEKEAESLQAKILKDIDDNGNPGNAASVNGKKYNP